MSALPSTPACSVKPTVVLACASDDAVAMAKVLRRLVERGVRVDVVAGVDYDVRPFQDALVRGTTRTVYVICRSDDLDAFQVDRLRTAAQNAKVTSDRLVLVPFDPELPIDFAETVLRYLAENGRMVRRVTRELPPVPVVGPRHSTSLDLAIVSMTTPPLRRATALLGETSASVAKTVTPLVAAPVVAAPVVAAPVVVAPVVAAPVVAAPVVSKPMPARVIAAPLVGAPTLAAPKVASTSAVAIPSGVANDESFFRLVLDATPANEGDAAMDFEDDFDDAITNVITLQADSMRLMTGVTTPMVGPTLPAPAPAPPAMIETAVAIVDLDAAAAATRPDWPQVAMAPTTPVQSEPSTASLSLSNALGEAFPSSRRAPAKRLAAAMAIAAAALATIVGIGRAQPEAAPASAQAWTRAATAAAVTSSQRGSAAATATSQDARPTPIETTAVMAAIEARTIRALDGLFVAVPKTAAMRRLPAALHCRDLVIAGLSNWRLPSADEIALLGGAGFVPDDSIWWRGGKKVRKPRVQWTGKRVRSQAAKKTAAARTVCVHALEL